MIKKFLLNKDLALTSQKYFSAVLAILFGVGIIGHVFGLESLMIQLTEGFVLLCNALVTFSLFWTTFAVTQKINYSSIIWFILVAIITFGVEAYGVYSGLVFGEYQYGSTFGMQLFGVPFVIGWNWIMVILGAMLFVRDEYNKFVRQRLLPFLMEQKILTEKNEPWIRLFAHFDIAILTGIIATLFDVILEPVAINYDYWSWAGGDVPFQNYAAWFSISFITAILLLKFSVPFYSRLNKDYLFYQTIFFISLLLHIS
jgi:putative membrane protein